MNNDGNVNVLDGNLIIGTSGHGIDFSAHGNASGMGSELLDDYEEGTWTPANNGTAFATAVGSYTKIGDRVLLLLSIACLAAFPVNPIVIILSVSYTHLTLPTILLV